MLKVISLMLAVCLSFTAMATQQLTWTDNSDNEDGFVVERRLFEELTFTQLAIVSGTTYDDSTPLAGMSYCYQVGAFNSAGTAYSGEYCIDIPTADEPVKTNKGKSAGKGRNKK